MDTVTSLTLALLLLILVSAFFSASEMAFSIVNRVRLRLLAEDGNERAARVLKLIENYDELLSTILIGNNIVNIASASIGTILFTRLIGEQGPLLSTVVLTVVVLVFGEITPKSIAKEKPESFTMAVAGILRIFAALFAPLNWLFTAWKKMLKKVFKLHGDDAITEDELIGIVEEAEDDGVLNENESELIRSAINFDDVEVGDILTHRVDMTAVPDTVRTEELHRVFLESGFSRVPVYHGTIDNVIGVVLEKDFYRACLHEGRPVTDILAQVEYTTEKTKISRLLAQLQKTQEHMAVVIDEYGGTQGIVTMEDILEELVGEIWDEHDDVESECVKQSDGTWLVSGSMGMDDFAEKFGIKVDGDITTVGGWVLSLTGCLPREGHTLTYDSYTISIVRVSKRRIQQIRMEKDGE